MRAIEQMTAEEVKAYRSYRRKISKGELSEVTPEEREASTKYQNVYDRLNPLNRRYRRTKHGAIRRGIAFELTFNDFVDLCNNTPFCPVLGVTLDYSVSDGCLNARPNSASLDRIDNSKGYTKENCWVVSWRANSLKKDATVDELKQLVDALERLTHATV